MPRAPFQILVLPYRKTAEAWQYAVFSRSTYPCWQGIAGGGEDDETPLEAAKREASEEAGIVGARFTPLQATGTVPVTEFRDRETWDPSLYVVPEHSFGADCTGLTLVISYEHDAVEWLSYEDAQVRFTYDSNRTALWELNQRLLELKPRDKDMSVLVT